MPDNANNRKVSVVIPVYNAEVYLPRCVESVVNQTFQNLEIILVNDGSTDGCGAICDGYAVKDRRIRVIHKTNGGPGTARNAGVDAASGELIFFVDSDDYIAPDCVEALYESLEQHNADCAVTALLYVYEKSGETFNKYNKNGRFGAMTKVESINTMLYCDNFNVSVCGKLFDLALFENLRFPAGTFCEDTAIIYKLLSRCHRVSHIAEAKYCYEKRFDNNRTADMGIKKVMDVIDTNEEMLAFVKEYIPDCCKAAVYYAFQVQFSICLKMRLTDEDMIRKYRYMRAFIKRHRISVLRDKNADLKVRFCCLMSFARFPAARLMWKIYKNTLRKK